MTLLSSFVTKFLTKFGHYFIHFAWTSEQNEVKHKYMLKKAHFSTNHQNRVLYFIEYSVHFFIGNDAEIFPAHFTWKVSEKGFKMAFMMNKLAVINPCEIIVEK